MSVRVKITLVIFEVVLLIDAFALTAGLVLARYRFSQTIEQSFVSIDPFFQQITPEQAAEFRGEILLNAHNSFTQSKQALVICALVVMVLGFLAALIAAYRLAGTYGKIDELQKNIDAELREKTQFLSMMSHKMRTPLNTINGLSEIELESGRLSDETFANIKRIHSSGKNLLSIIDNLFGITEPETAPAPDEPVQDKKIVRANMSYAAVLVVDDVPTNLDVARGMLELYGMKVDCVDSGEEAVQCIRSEKVHYDAIFMDQMMPGMNGTEALQVIRNQIDSDYARTIPIIVLTADVLPGSDRLYMQYGFQAFIPKPIDPIRLDGVLNLLVRDAAKEKDLPPLSENIDEKKSTGIFDGVVIAGLDISSTLVMLDNDEETCLHILHTYAEHTPNYLAKIRDEGCRIGLGDLNDYRIAVHGLKGSSRGVGAGELGALAEKLEDAAKRGDRAFIQEHNAPFVSAVEQLLSCLGAFLADIDAKKANAKPELPSPDPELIKAVLAACETYDIRGLRSAIESLSAYNYTSSPDLVRWLEAQADLSNFSEIQKRIDSFSEIR